MELNRHCDRIIYSWSPSIYCDELLFKQYDYKNSGLYKFFKVSNTMNEFDVKDCVYEINKNRIINNNLKGRRGGVCNSDDCNFTHNVFYLNEDGKYYCYKCSLLINKYKETCFYDYCGMIKKYFNGEINE